LQYPPITDNDDISQDNAANRGANRAGNRAVHRIVTENKQRSQDCSDDNVEADEVTFEPDQQRMPMIDDDDDVYDEDDADGDDE
jgi:hypothetical protein